jgi:hypothetical protein
LTLTLSLLSPQPFHNLKLRAIAFFEKEGSPDGARLIFIGCSMYMVIVFAPTDDPLTRYFTVKVALRATFTAPRSFLRDGRARKPSAPQLPKTPGKYNALVTTAKHCRNAASIRLAY